MKNLKISSKLKAIFAVINAIFVLCIAALLLSYMMSNDRLNNMNQTAVQPQIIMESVRDAILRERVAATRLVLAQPGSAEYTACIDALSLQRERALQAISAYITASKGTTGETIAGEIQDYYINEYSVGVDQITRIVSEEGAVAASEWMAASASVEESMDKLLDSATGLIDGRIKYFISDAWVGLVRLYIIAAVVIVFLIIFIVCIINYMQRSISKRIEKLTEAAKLMAAGDLNIDINVDSTDEIGRLTESFQDMADCIKAQAQTLSAIAEGDLTVDIAPRSENDTMNTAIKRMIDSLQLMFAQILGSTSQVSAGSKQIADGAQSLALGATEQASAVETLSNSISGVAKSTQDSSAMAKQAAELMESVNSNATDGSLQMGRMAQAVHEISEASQAISKVIKAIDEIAFQTNILALNAAVEAARAGSHGKGFAVVAEEVRNLASKSAQAAKETGALIENSIQKAELGTQIAEEAVTSFQQIVAGISRSADLLQEIAQLSGQQYSTINQINQSVSQVSQVVQQNSATAQQSAASSQELSSQSTMLERLISRFRISEAHLLASGDAVNADTYDVSFSSLGKY